MRVKTFENGVRTGRTQVSAPCVHDDRPVRRFFDDHGKRWWILPGCAVIANPRGSMISIWSRTIPVNRKEQGTSPDSSIYTLGSPTQRRNHKDRYAYDKYRVQRVNISVATMPRMLNRLHRLMPSISVWVGQTIHISRYTFISTRYGVRGMQLARTTVRAKLLTDNSTVPTQLVASCVYNNWNG